MFKGFLCLKKVIKVVFYYMHLIKLDAIDSTNSYIRQLIAENLLEDFTIVITDQQTQGRGQMGTLWKSEPFKNLTFSVFKDVSFLKMKHSYAISMIVSLALLKTLKLYSIKNVQIKWPNDILSEQKKVAGILIENVLKKGQLKNSIIGIGLNVNQTNFEGLPRASSLKVISGTNYNLNEVLQIFVQQLKDGFDSYNEANFSVLKKAYETHLFRKNKPSTFKDAKGELFTGYIKGTSDSGNLQVLVEDDIIKEFDHKTIELLY